MKKKHKKVTGTWIENPLFQFYVLAGVLIILLPVFYLNHAIDTVLMPRLFLLDLLLLVFGIFLLLKGQIKATDLSLLRNAVLVASFSYFLITAISLIFALNPHEGFFDVVKTFSVFVLIFMLTTYFTTTPDWAGILAKLMLFAGSVAVLIGFYEYLTLVVGSTEQFLPDGREMIYAVRGLMAHKNQFSDYMMMLLPFLMYGAIRFEKLLKAGFIALIVMILFLIILLQTRSVWVGIIISSVVCVAVLLIFYRQFLLPKKSRNIIAVVSLAIILTFSGIIAFGGRQKYNSSLSRLRSIASPQAGNNSYRLKVWGATIEMIRYNPVVGVGAGNWQLEVSKYLPDLNFVQKEMNWGRPHNDYLWVLSEKGIFGIMLYLLIFIISFIYSFRIILGENDLKLKIITLLTMGGLISYMVVSFFTFTYERIDHQVYLAIFIAAIASIHQQQKPAKPLKFNRYAFSLPVLLILLLGSVFSFATVLQEIHLKNARTFLDAGKWKESVQEGLKARNSFRNIDPEGMPVDWVIAQAYANAGDHQKAIVYFESALQAHPYNFVVLNNVGKSYFLTGDLQNAKKSFETALTYLPNFTESLVNLASVEYTLGEKPLAYQLLTKIPESDRTPAINQNIEALDKEIKKEIKKAARKAAREATRKQKAKTNNEKKQSKNKKRPSQKRPGNQH
jgi:O-antigen ligase/Tfp pilus assembly protein PilF